MTQKQSNKKHGFSIVELLVVIVVIGIITAISVVSYGAIQRRVVETELKNDLLSASKSLKTAMANNMTYPNSINCTVADTTSNKCIKPSGNNSYSYTPKMSGSGISVQGFNICVNRNGTDMTYCMTESTNPSLGTALTWKQVSVTYGYTCAIASNDNAYCWGAHSGDGIGTYGMIGNGTSTGSLIPVLVNANGILNGKTILSITTGATHACAIASDHKAYCWGSVRNGQYGELGNNSNDGSLVPVAVNTDNLPGDKTVKSISAGYSHTCAIASNDKVYCWGANGSGELGNASTDSSLVPMPVSTAGVLNNKNISLLSTGRNATCVVTSDGNPYCWGSNESGALGNNSTIDTYSDVPVAVDKSGVLNNKTILAVSTGSAFACVIASDNKPYCWGSNANGQSGSLSYGYSLVPVGLNYTENPQASSRAFTSIRSGDFGTCGIDGTHVYCWGNLSNDHFTVSGYDPLSEGLLVGKTIIDIDTTDRHTCLITNEGKMYCWGYNWADQLGVNITEYPALQNDNPVPVINVYE